MKTEEKKQFLISDFNDRVSGHSESMASGNGHVTLEGDLEITGYFSGMLKLNGNLTVGKNARIIGDFFASNMKVHGKIIGTATISGKAIFLEGSEFSGILSASEAEIHEGSKISGIRNIRSTGRSNLSKNLTDQPGNRAWKEAAPSIAGNPIFNI